MLTRHVAVVAETTKVNPSDLTIAAAAIQKQVTRDFGPLWGVTATVSAFAKLEDVPTDYWPVMIRDDIKTPGAGGVHEDDNGQPFALVQFSNEWSLTLSHEILEMLCDPFGNRIVAGQSPKDGQGRVNFLVEVCDPSEDTAFSYTVNGVTVSDFYTPHFFDPGASTGVRYSFTDSIKSPRTILKGGYLSWGVPETNEWFQQIWFNTTEPTFRSLGVLSGKRTGNLRSTIDSLTPTPIQIKLLAQKASLKAVFTSSARTIRSASIGRAKRLRTQIAALKRKK